MRREWGGGVGEVVGNERFGWGDCQRDGGYHRGGGIESTLTTLPFKGGLSGGDGGGGGGLGLLRNVV